MRLEILLPFSFWNLHTGTFVYHLFFFLITLFFPEDLTLSLNKPFVPINLILAGRWLRLQPVLFVLFRMLILPPFYTSTPLLMLFLLSGTGRDYLDSIHLRRSSFSESELMTSTSSGGLCETRQRMCPPPASGL